MLNSKEFQAVSEGLERTLEIKDALINKEVYSENTGWLELPKRKSNATIAEQLAKKHSEKSDILVLIGVGGSYLGARAVIDALKNPYNKGKEVIYLGNSLSSLDLKQALDYLKDKDFSVNYVSKSGKTLEPAVAFRAVLKLLKEKHGDKAKNYVVVTTGGENLKEYSERQGFEVLDVPEDVGGRYSVLSLVGLFPIAFAGYDVKAFLKGAEKALNEFIESDYSTHIQYAMTRYFQGEVKGKDIELLAYYEPRLKHLGDWWRQLFSESEGKDGKGLFPAPVCYTTDLHSIGQMVQDGKRNMFELHVFFDSTESYIIQQEENDFDGLNFLEGIDVERMNEIAKDGVVEAHSSEDFTVFEMRFGELNEESLGYFMNLFQITCAVSAMLIDVNPFNQPGVEDYKINVMQGLKDEVSLERNI